MKREKQKNLLALSVIWILFCLQYPLRATEEEIPYETSFRGQFKSVVGIQQLRQENLYPASSQYYIEERLRFMASLSKGWLYAEVANDTRFRIENLNRSYLPLPSTENVPFWDASWKIRESENSSFVTKLDRAYIQAFLELIELRIGKQVVPIGVGHIFSAVSQTPRYSFVDVDSEYEKTEDAATLIIKKTVNIEFRYLKKNPGQENDNFHLRWLFNLLEADAALIIGGSDDKYFVGTEATRKLGQDVTRAEVILYKKNNSYFLQALFGLDRVWNSKWSSKHELFYNGFSEKRHRSSNFRNKYYFGNILSYDYSPKLKVNTLVITNLSDPSFLLHLYFNYSLSDNMDLMLGHYQNIKTKEDSEFGGMISLPALPNVKMGLPDLTYLLMKWTF